MKISSINEMPRRLWKHQDTKLRWMHHKQLIAPAFHISLLLLNFLLNKDSLCLMKPDYLMNILIYLINFKESNWVNQQMNLRMAVLQTLKIIRINRLRPVRKKIRYRNHLSFHHLNLKMDCIVINLQHIRKLALWVIRPHMIFITRVSFIRKVIPTSTLWNNKRIKHKNKNINKWRDKNYLLINKFKITRKWAVMTLISYLTIAKIHSI